MRGSLGYAGPRHCRPAPIGVQALQLAASSCRSQETLAASLLGVLDFRQFGEGRGTWYSVRSKRCVREAAYPTRLPSPPNPHSNTHVRDFKGWLLKTPSEGPGFREGSHWVFEFLDLEDGAR